MENPVDNLLKEGMASDKIDPIRIARKRRYSMGSKPNPLDKEFRKEADEISAHRDTEASPRNDQGIPEETYRRLANDPNLLNIL